jgi:hypothetical protein
MLIADRAATTRQAQVLFEFLDNVIPVQQQPHRRVSGKEGYNIRDVQLFRLSSHYLVQR